MALKLSTPTKFRALNIKIPIFSLLATSDCLIGKEADKFEYFQS